jgi:cell division protein ZapE
MHITRIIEPAMLPASGTVTSRYEALVASGAIERDPAQENLVGRLDVLALRLGSRHHLRLRFDLGGRVGLRGRAGETVRGVFVCGPVGRGKTMLMDLFFDSVALTAKRRIHFHAFMAEMRDRIQRVCDQIRFGEIGNGDPIALAIKSLAVEARLLCIDELTITDIADATILRRFLAELFAHGVVLAVTANVEPDQLYEGGVNRALFLPFVDLLKERVEIVRLESRTDFRLEQPEGERVWYMPADSAARSTLDRIFRELTSGAEPEALTLDVCGHAVRVPLHARGIARFTYRELCVAPLGASDYIAFANRFHTLIIDCIPLNFVHRNHVKRLCTLIDVLYERRVKLIVSAEAEPRDLCRGMIAVLRPAIGLPRYQSETSPDMLEITRTVSRLVGMRSRDYLALSKNGAI